MSDDVEWTEAPPCGCRPYVYAGITEPGSLDPSCPVHGEPTC
jgi:hypothetical protein